MTPATQTPLTMSAIEVQGTGPSAVLVPAIRPVPVPRKDEVLVKVHAAGVNRPDLLQRQGLYPPPPGVTDIPGLEVSGVIVQMDPSVQDPGLSLGRRVCALVAGGGYAEYVSVPVGQILPVPDGWRDDEAAALPEGLFTVYQNLFIRGRMQAGESVLMHGGTSGIGTLAIQMVRVLCPTSRIFVTCGTAEKVKAALALGAQCAINYNTDVFEDRVRDETKGQGVDLVLDMMGGAYVSRNLSCLRYGGRHISIATQNGSTTTLDLRLLMMNNLTLTGGTLRARSVQEKTCLRDDILRNVWPAVEGGKIKPIVHATFPLANALAAQAALERGDHIGKVVLTVSSTIL